jgi:hypothetical protein
MCRQLLQLFVISQLSVLQKPRGDKHKIFHLKPGCQLIWLIKFSFWA